MKKSAKILLFSILCIFMFTECEKQLELTPLGQLDEFTFYQTENDFEAASLSPYSTLLNFYYDQGGLGWYQGVLFPDDDVTAANNGSNDQEDFNWNPNNDQFTYIWEQSYKGIQRANVIIDRLPLAKQFSDTGKKARFEAEAKFLRAYFHFLLAIHFGNPPISDKAVTTVSEARKGNSQPGEIWNFIISDLEYAKANLPADWDAKNKGRVTSGAASGMLGKVYLYRAQWENNASFYGNAISEFNSIVASGKYALIPKFEENFNPNTENNQESLFEIQFTRGDFNPWLPTDFGADGDQNVGAAGTARNIFWRPSCGPGNVCAPGANGMGYGQVHVTQSLQNAFEPNDPRISNTFWRPGDDFLGKPYDAAWSVTGSTPAKYVRQNLVEFTFPLNIEENNDRIIRYADVLLMLAEAELLGNNNVNRAAELINQVRRRADPTGTILPDRPANVDKNQMFQWLMQERRAELALEGNRYNDLVRWHRAGLINIKTDVNFGRTAANQNWSEKHLLKPIPQRELDLNSNLVQNPLY